MSHEKRPLLWALIRKKKNFSVTELYNECVTLMHITSIKTYVKQLQKAGIVRLVEEIQKTTQKRGPVDYIEHRYELVRDLGVQRPHIMNNGSIRPPSGNQRIWAAIKVLKQFDHRDVTLTSEVGTNTVKTYLTVLCHAGYLRILKQGTSHYPHRYIFLGKMDTGPLAPRIRKSGAVYDANLKQDVWHKEKKNDTKAS